MLVRRERRVGWGGGENLRYKERANPLSRARRYDGGREDGGEMDAIDKGKSTLGKRDWSGGEVTGN